MKKLFILFTANTQKQLIEQEEKHAMESAAMKHTNMETKNLLTKETMSAQPVNDHRASAHVTAMTKPSEILFDGKPENWPEFEHHLLNEAENPTIGWNQEVLNFQLMDTKTKPCNFLEGYFNIPENMIGALQDDLCVMKHRFGMCDVNQFMKHWKYQNTLKCPQCGHIMETPRHVNICPAQGAIYRWDK
jgi:hypothetical protein